MDGEQYVFGRNDVGVGVTAEEHPKTGPPQIILTVAKEGVAITARLDVQRARALFTAGLAHCDALSRAVIDYTADQEGLFDRMEEEAR